MVDLNLLKNLVNSKNQAPSEKVVEEHFDQIVDYIERENTGEAAKLIEKVFAKNVPDIRLIVYYFYVHFATHGIQSFEETFPILTQLVNDHWEILTPKNRIDKHVQNSLNWFFSQVLLRLKYCEKLHHSGKVHPIWKKSVMEMTTKDLNRLLASVEKFESFILEKWSQHSPVKDRVLHLVKKIEEIKGIVAESEKIVDPVKDHMQEDEVPDSDDQNLLECASFQPPEEMTEQVPAVSPPPFVEEVKPAETPLVWMEKWELLKHKLQVFEALIEKNEHLKAAVVAHDIDHLIKNFNPLDYFPKVFGRYLSLFATHVSSLSEKYNSKDAAEVQALEKLYRADLEMFLEWQPQWH